MKEDVTYVTYVLIGQCLAEPYKENGPFFLEKSQPIRDDIAHVKSSLIGQEFV